MKHLRTILPILREDLEFELAHPRGNNGRFASGRRGLGTVHEPHKNKAQGLLRRAKKVFGTTDIFDDAGYVLPDGSMLDFHRSSCGAGRDHREVHKLYRGSEWRGFGERSDFMGRFMHETGAMRVAPGYEGAQVIRMPSDAAIRTLVDSWRKLYKGRDMYIDVSDKYRAGKHCAAEGGDCVAVQRFAPSDAVYGGALPLVFDAVKAWLQSVVPEEKRKKKKLSDIMNAAGQYSTRARELGRVQLLRRFARGD